MIKLSAYTLQTMMYCIAEDNRRYTMRDIGNLETRIKNIEYYTQLSLLEIRRTIFTNTRRRCF